MLQQIFSEHFWSAVVGSVAFWFIALILLGLSYVFLDRILLRKVNFAEELKKGNTAVAIVIAAFFIGIALVIFGVTN